MVTITPQFNFPAVCCRCVARPGQQRWLVINQDLKPNPHRTVPKTYTIEVPVCSTCKRELEEIHKSKEYVFWVIVGVSALVATLTWVVFANGYRSEWWVGTILGVTIGLIIIIFGIWPTMDSHNRGKICDIVNNGQTLVFSSSEYQKLFDELNRKKSKS